MPREYFDVISRSLDRWIMLAALVDSVIFIAPARLPHREAQIGRLRDAGLLPVAVNRVDAALQMMRQFSVTAVVFRVELSGAEEGDCERLMAAGATLILVATSPNADAIARRIASGCSAVVAEPFTARELAAIVRRVKSGEKAIVHPAYLAAVR